jgi:hypothetical protein
MKRSSHQSHLWRWGGAVWLAASALGCGRINYDPLSADANSGIPAVSRPPDAAPAAAQDAPTVPPQNQATGADGPGGNDGRPGPATVIDAPGDVVSFLAPGFDMNGTSVLDLGVGVTGDNAPSLEPDAPPDAPLPPALVIDMGDDFASVTDGPSAITAVDMVADTRNDLVADAATDVAPDAAPDLTPDTAPDLAPSKPCVWGPFSATEILSEISSSGVDWAPSLSADGLTLFFGSGPSNAAMSIWVATRPTLQARWRGPAPLSQVNAAGVPFDDPALSPDGLELLIAQTGIQRLWQTRRTLPSDPFPPPTTVQGLPTNTRGPYLFGTLTLYACVGNDMTLFTRATTSTAFVQQRVLTELNFAGATSCWPTLSRDGLEIFFESNRSGRSLLYRSQRPTLSDPFTAPLPVLELNPGGTLEVGDPELSFDGTTLLFGSNAPGAGMVGQFDIWSATRSCLP